MRWLLVAAALLTTACAGSSSAPTPVTPPPATTPPVTTPPVTPAVIDAQPCPTSLSIALDVTFYRQIGCNAFDGPLFSVKRWTVAPRLYIRTVDEAGAAIDPVTLDTVTNAMRETAPLLTAGKFGLAMIERGSETREGVSGWITVKWPATAQNFCGNSDVARDGGTIDLNTKSGTACSCNGSAIRPRTARHELGHALGYWHTEDPNDLMSNIGTKPCDQQPSAREQQAFAYHYR